MWDEIPTDELRADDLPASDAEWSDIARFALTFDGYEYVKALRSVEDVTGACKDLALAVRRAMAHGDESLDAFSLDDFRDWLLCDECREVVAAV